jgi:DNA-binding MarR family transcriptional regulator
MSRRRSTVDPVGRVGYRLTHTQHLLRAALDRELAEHSLTTPQFNVLAALDRLTGHSGATLAREALVTPQTMNPIVRALEDRHLIQRARDPFHRRILRIEMTESGRRLLATATKVVSRVEARMLRGIEGADRERLQAQLDRCARNLTVRPGAGTAAADGD